MLIIMTSRRLMFSRLLFCQKKQCIVVLNRKHLNVQSEYLLLITYYLLLLVQINLGKLIRMTIYPWLLVNSSRYQSPFESEVKTIQSWKDLAESVKPVPPDGELDIVL